MRSAIPMASNRITGRDNAAFGAGIRDMVRALPLRRLDVVARRLAVVSNASPAMHRFTPRQPIQDPTQAASGTPISSVSDCPLITQPSARPCWLGSTRADTSVKVVPLNRPQNPPAMVAQTATLRKLGAVATPT